MNLTQLFDLSLVGRRDETALEWRGEAYTFGELDARSNRLAHLLARRGLRTGDRLAVYLANSRRVDRPLPGLHQAGRYRRAGQHPLSRPRNGPYSARLPTRRRWSRRLPSNARRRCGIPRRWPKKRRRCRADRPQAPSEGSAPAALVYTSGTTGASKGAILTHNNFAANAINLLACWQITAADRFLLALPLFHVHGLGNGLHCWLMSGCRMRLLERFEHQTAAATFLDFRPTLFFGVPTMYVRLLETAPEAAREIGGFMRLFVSGSAPLARAGAGGVPRALRPHHSGALRHERDAHDRQQSVRRRAARGHRGPAAAGRRHAPGGWRDPGAGGRTYSPDTGGAKRPRARRSWMVGSAPATWRSARADGYYTLCGRKSDLIISGGFNIYPREIEEFLEEQEEVAEAAVVGRPDAVRGEVPVAYVVLKRAVEDGATGARCREKLASFKMPREFHAVERLPRNAMGKVQKHLL